MSIDSAPADARYDAEHFFHALYAGQPAGTLIAVGAPQRMHYVLSPADALPWVVNKKQVYHRISLLGARPHGGGRGEARDSVALPGVWADFDVVGGPRNDGTPIPVGTAAPTRDAAVAVAHAVAHPTLLVDSGYGLHAYWLFAAMLHLDESNRDAAQALLARMHARIRREASFPVDSTYDLARILRPPGSLNAKGSEPVAVRLLDDSGPRYSVEDVESWGVDVELELADQPASMSSPPEILKTYPEIARLAQRQGTPPRDGSPSEWDWQMTLTAMEEGLDDFACVHLIEHARSLHRDRKGRRPDYVERTVRRAREKVGKQRERAETKRKGKSQLRGERPRKGAPPEEIATWVTAQLRLEEDPVISATRLGDGDDALIYLHRRSGARVRMHQGEFFTGKLLARHIVNQTRCEPPIYSDPDALALAVQVIRLCAEEEVIDQAEVTREYIEHFMAVRGTVRGRVDDWHVLLAAKRKGSAIQEPDGTIHIPAGPFCFALNREMGVPCSYGRLESLMREIDWKRRVTQRWEPGIPRGKGERVQLVLYAGRLWGQEP